jgi:holo-[acyl-carrier protein] synthase
MPILGVGIDIVEAARVEELLARHGERLLAKLFTPEERTRAATYARPFLHLAARIAVKEAAYKALSGDGRAHGVGWQDLEVTRHPDGRPGLRMREKALRRMAELGATRCHLSITHSAGVAAAVVILE